MLPFAWGSWNCLLPEICGLGFGRERADPREKISFSKLNHTLLLERIPVIRWTGEKAKACSFVRSGSLGHSTVGGLGRSLVLVPRMQPGWLGLGLQRKDHKKLCFSNVNVQTSHLGIL